MSRLPRAEVLLPFVILAGALILAASELMIAFEFTPPGGEALREQSNADRHLYAMLILAIAAIVALLVAVATGSKPAAFAVAGLGGAALLLFLIIDLPDAGNLGALDDFKTARAEPQSGFWMEALGAVVLALGGAAFATLSPEQLRTLPERFRRRRGPGGGAEPEPSADAPSGS